MADFNSRCKKLQFLLFFLTLSLISMAQCDHGRGDKVKSEWKHHGSKIADAHEIWMAVIGPDTKPLGEMKMPAQLYQRQIATTIAKLLGFNFKPAHPVQEPVETVFK